MLFKLSFAQIALYLFIVPVLRVALDQKSLADYDFLLVTLATFAFLVGATRALKPRINNGEGRSLIILSDFGVLIWLIWSFVYCLVSIEFGLFNRRVGTEVAAEMFAQFPLWILFVFRLYEILLPIVIASFIIEQPRRILRWAAIAFTIAAFSLGGAIFSRSALALILLLVMVFLQNMYTRKQLRLFVIGIVSAGLLVGAAVTSKRATLQQSSLDSEFFTREFLERLDGLEVVSSLTKEAGTFNVGIEPKAIAVPVLASLGFLPGAIELKKDGITTVKALILTEHMNINQRDINSFFILDAYYVGGTIFVLVAFYLVGAFSRFIDSRIGLFDTKFASCLLMAAAMNLIVLEREFVGIVIGTIRDVFIIYFFLQLIGQKEFSQSRIKM